MDYWIGFLAGILLPVFVILLLWDHVHYVQFGKLTCFWIK